MTLNDFLKKTEVDISDIQSPLGNLLEAELKQRSINIDFEKDITAVTELELLEIGRILILSQNKGKPFHPYEIVEWMKSRINKYH